MSPRKGKLYAEARAGYQDHNLLMYPKAFIPSAEAFAKNPRISEEEDDDEEEYDDEEVSEESDSGDELSEIEENKQVF